MRLIQNFYKLFIDLIELKNNYRKLYFNQLILNQQLKEKIETLKMNRHDKIIYQ